MCCGPSDRLQELGQAAVFVASKIDEHPRKIKDVLHAALCMRFKTDDISGSFSFADDAPEYVKLKERLLCLEKILLQTCCFDLTIKHPYNYVFRNVKLLRDPSVEDQLVQSAWVVINDSLRTTICIRFAPKAVSAAALYYAARREAIDLGQLVGLPAGSDPVEAEIFAAAPQDQVRDIMAILDTLYDTRTPVA